MSDGERKESLILLSALTLIILLFLFDILTPFLHNVWFLYTFPLLLSFPSTRKGISYILSATITLFISIEILLVNNPPALPNIWKISHVYAFIGFWIIAVLLERYKRAIGFRALNEKIKEANTKLQNEIRERALIQDKLRRISIIDELTGLYNRRGFFELAEKQLAVIMRKNMKALLVFMDLDNLKVINDTLGHGEGDDALIDTTGILRATFRQSDIIARIGGDEFVVFSGEETEDTIGAMISRFQGKIGDHNKKNVRPYELSISIGYVFCSKYEKCSIGRLLEIADKRMYEHKLRKNRKDTPINNPADS